jgi:phytoene dehydrogenase-like protein
LRQNLAMSWIRRLGIAESAPPVSEVQRPHWDAIVVGAGHNGLACAAYLARAGKHVLVLEARNRIGGACTIEEKIPGVRLSPCAYLAGLLHPLVIQELDLASRGFHWTAAAAGLFIPFEDGTSVQLYDDDWACDAELKRFAPGDVEGWRAMMDLIRRTRDALRPPGSDDVWIGEAPTREQIEDRLSGDREALHMLFDWSMAEMVEHYLRDERLQAGYLGQGVIGTNASPFDAGTASIRFHHASGRMGGLPGAWGYVKGGVGVVSFLIADAAEEAGASILTNVPVAQILPGEGVVLENGARIEALTVIVNADPRVALKLLGSKAEPEWRKKVESVPIQGCTVKLNVVLRELPNFRARPGVFETHHHGQINTPLSKQQWKDGYRAAREGKLPERMWTELYFQSVHDPGVAPPGLHTMSVFSQYVPYRFAEGTWDSRREEVKQRVLDSMAVFCSNIPEAVVDCQVMGPPDIEQKVGLTGGHIFQGECLPPYMWSNRLQARTPIEGVYLCGAATYPGGSVMGINGRNAAMAVLADQQGKV